MSNVANLIQGPGVLYVAQLAAAEPADGSVHLTPDVNAWTPVGYTRDGVTLSFRREFKELEVDQLADVPERRLVKRETWVKTNFAEATLANLKVALNGGAITTTAPGTTTSGIAVYTPTIATNTAPTYSALIFDGFAPSGFARRLILRKVLQVENVQAVYSKNDQAVFSVQFACHFVDSNTAPYKVIDATAAPTG